MENRGENLLAPLSSAEQRRSDAAARERCVSAVEESEAEPNAVRRLGQLRTPANAPLAGIDGFYEALDQLADMVDEWLQRNNGSHDATSAKKAEEVGSMDIDEGMIVTVEEFGMRFVVTDIYGDRVLTGDGRCFYRRIDSMRLIPLRERAGSEGE